MSQRPTSCGHLHQQTEPADSGNEEEESTMKLKTYFWAMLGLLIPVAAFADVTMTALTSGQINT